MKNWDEKILQFVKDEILKNQKLRLELITQIEDLKALFEKNPWERKESTNQIVEKMKELKDCLSLIEENIAFFNERVLEFNIKIKDSLLNEIDS